MNALLFVKILTARAKTGTPAFLKTVQRVCLLLAMAVMLFTTMASGLWENIEEAKRSNISLWALGAFVLAAIIGGIGLGQSFATVSKELQEIGPNTSTEEAKQKLSEAAGNRAVANEKQSSGV